MPTIVLADDHHIVRQALRALLETEPDFELVGEAGDGLEALRVVGRLQPRVLVCDVMMPALNGLEVVRQITQRTKTRDETIATLSVVWGCVAFESRLREAERWYRSLVESTGATTRTVHAADGDRFP